MKVHYINILLFALPLNILAHNKNKPSITSHIQTNRSLCECELYAPANYDNDPQMKKIMDNFSKQTQQRFHEYDERMKTTRQKCKHKCDKEIQKIILTDKLEKELMDKFATLQTDIHSDAIPTCICEKSIADKTEQFCLKCGVNVGGGVTLSSGVLGGIGAAALSPWQTKTIAAAITAAKEAGAVAGKIAGDIKGMEIVTERLGRLYVKDLIPGISEKISGIGHYTKVTSLDEFIYGKYRATCAISATGKSANQNSCGLFDIDFGFYDINGSPKGAPDSTTVKQALEELVEYATQGANAEATQVAGVKKAAAIKTSKGAIEATSYNWYTTISYSITAILIIVLIMVIIYLILRYRRKKKMKKKLQYIKLLEE
ncbi:rifin PIR protein, putative [Plasmodium reichenowi]|uniref:Rifin PIR protein, putative n=1 Tax=Plasmodium reichenowi TaxID=5854 RepID=A0A2P9DS77_PLARE|nr:rifin PIR protein, putative [Plasmodium reichenowi]